ncbi:MAG: metal-sensitive transcriptional regulator [Armatimonadetes bacterium]|nr:metal-sensitive transcriptional regulator [Armatimonadota bacterium]
MNATREEICPCCGQPAPPEEPGHESDSQQDKLLQRLRRIEGQVRGLQRMIRAGRDCEEVVTQLAAAKAAFEQMSFLFISTHLRTCLRKDSHLDASADPTIDKAVQMFMKLT